MVQRELAPLVWSCDPGDEAPERGSGSLASIASLVTDLGRSLPHLDSTLVPLLCLWQVSVFLVSLGTCLVTVLRTVWTSTCTGRMGQRHLALSRGLGCVVSLGPFQPYSSMMLRALQFLHLWSQDNYAELSEVL